MAKQCMKMTRLHWKPKTVNNNNFLKRFITYLKNYFAPRFVYFGRNSSIQGLKYVFHEKGTCISRSIWLLLLLVFIGWLYLLLVPVIRRGGSVTLTLDTSYLNWNTKFPGVTVCEKNTNTKDVQKKLKENFPFTLGALNAEYIRYIADVAFGQGTCKASVCVPCGTVVDCYLHWRLMFESVHKKCDELITKCYFNNVEFSCCKHFYTVDSEHGPCFSFNSLQGQYTDEPQFFVNRSTGPGVLSFRLWFDAHISVHSSEELSTNFLDQKFKLDVHTNLDKVVDYYFSIVEVDAEPGFENENISIRKCRYSHEIPGLPMHTYQVYSYGACRLALNTEKSFNSCHCIHPVRDIRYKNYYCNYTGINCLVKYDFQKKKLSKKNDDSDAVLCLPACVESELNTIHISRRRRQAQDQNDGALVNIRMASLPTVRYQKSLLRTKLDFVVTIGGMVGLFFSASILSFAEIFYLILRSPNKNK